jgi:hypothetical protein
MSCFQDVLPFKLDETVWAAKQNILETVGKVFISTYCFVKRSELSA